MHSAPCGDVQAGAGGPAGGPLLCFAALGTKAGCTGSIPNLAVIARSCRAAISS